MRATNLTLLTDLYELTMMNGYFAEGKLDEIKQYLSQLNLAVEQLDMELILR